ncbi:MAG: M23 family metallopeptidase [Spirochaetaceae bacterium]|nr:M23 family metallopeptidase [Spirochaetaceae bacterium]
MSRKKTFLTIFLPLIVIISSISISITVMNHKVNDSENIYEDSAEVKAFYKRFEENRKASQVTLEESRVIASKWIKKEQANISRHLFYRRRAYDLISRTILKAETYEELNYHLSRLPSTEKQAYTTLTVDRSSITTLSNYSGYISSLLFPIQLPGKANDGKDLLISSYFSSKRVSPVGSGGARPHYAVDIINIGNINYVNEEGELVRDDNPPGYIAAVADGIVTNLEYNHVYGWNMTIEHDRSLLPISKRNNVKSFETFYAHLDEKIYVNIGDILIAGQNLAQLGNSGLSTGPHLHYEIRINYNDGTQSFVNPYPGSEW